MRRKKISPLSLLALALSFALWGTNARADGQSPITYHGGPVMSSANVNVYFIWYGNWSGSSPGSNLLTQYILSDLAINIGFRPRFNTNSTYSDSNGNVSNVVIFGGFAEDAYSHGTTLSVSDVQEVVARLITARYLPADPAGIYVVLASSDVIDKRLDGTNFCTPDAPPHHGVFSYNGAWMKYAFIGNPERCPATAGAQFIAPDGSRLPTPNTDFAGDSMASSLIHALDTTVTDPFRNAWFDSQGKENADKCQGTFGKTYLTPSGARANMRLGDRDYLIQQNWVNQQLGYCALSVDNAPVASDQSVGTYKDTPKTFTPTVSDADGDALLYRIVTQPQHGTLTGTDSATLTYTPGPNYTGTDSFTFKADDGKLVSNVATVSITVTSPISALDGFDPNANGIVRSVVVQPDGKILIGGDFTSLAPQGGPSVARYYIARLNVDGTVDAAFNTGTNTSVYAIALQPDGKILVGGSFTMLLQNDGASVTRNDIARLNADGTVDTTFDPNTDGDVDAIAVQPDGKILIGGFFPALAPNGGPSVTRHLVARLNVDGTVDAAFDPNVNNGKSVRAITVQPDGKILIVGDFTSLAPNGGASVRRNNIARVKADGTLDAAFDPNANAIINAIALRPDGKILIGGGFNTLVPNGAAGGFNRNYIARLNADGTVDTPFNANPNAAVRAVAVQADGKILIGGGFTAFGGLTRHYMARLNEVGSVEVAFLPNPNSDVYAIAVQADGKIVLGGNFSGTGGVRGQTRNCIARLETDGRLDQTLKLNTVGRYASAAAVQADGKILIGGGFTSVLGVTRNNIARLNTDGTLDTAFNPNANDIITAITAQADGKILIGGNFTTLAPGGGPTITRNHIARLNADGTVDAAFDPNANAIVNAIAVQADGKILTSGSFTALAPGGGPTVTRNRIARLNTDGTVDTTFDPNANAGVYTIVLQPDGKILIGGGFTTLAPGGGASVRRNYLARLNADGTLDAAFDPSPSSGVLALAVQPDGKILIGGAFTTVAPSARAVFPRNYIARLNADGTVDAAFDQSADDVVEAIALQADGKILIGGDFNTLTQGGGATVTRDNIARLNADGTLDVAFAPSASDGVFVITLQPDGKILVGGESGSIGGQMFARLTNDAAALQSLSVTQTTLTWTRSGAAPQLSRVTFELSTDGVNYTFLGQGARVGTTNDFTLTGQNLSTQQNLYVRARGFYRGGDNAASESVTESVRNVFLLPALHLSFAQQPNATAVGSSIMPAIAVQILDSSNNPVSSTASVTIAIGTNPSSGTLSGTQTVAAINGTATFNNLSINKVGTGYTLVASSPFVAGVISDPFNITVGVPSIINATAGSGQSAAINSTFARALQAAVTDAYGNPVSGATVTFNAPLSGASGTFSNNTTTTATTDASGIATASAFTANGTAGPYNVAASINAGASSTNFSLTNNKADQHIAVKTHAPSSAGYNKQFTVAATASSGLGVSYGSSGSCTNDGATVTMTSAKGTCTVTYNQSGDSNYNAATQVTESVTAQKGDQTITFGALADKTFGDADFTLSATASSGLSVSFAASGQCTVSGNSVHLTGAGPCTLTASQSGNSDFNAAADVAQPFQITKSATATTVTSSATPSNLGQSVTLTATVSASAGAPTGTVQFKDNGTGIGSPQALSSSSVASLSVSSLTEGTHTITADYSGDANYGSSAGTLSGGQVVLSLPSLSINDVSVVEGNSGATNAVLTVTLSSASSLTVKVDFATADGTAAAGSGYTPASGTLVFNPGETQKTITVSVNGDTRIEPDETFFVNLASQENAAISKAQGVVTITNDDQAGTLQFSEAGYSVAEDAGSLQVTVTRAGANLGAVSVDYLTSDASDLTSCNVATGMASQRCDYTFAAGTLTFAAGETSKTITILVNDDSYVEGNETLTLRLGNTAGTTLGAQSAATVTIMDNDLVQGQNLLDTDAFFVRQHYHDFLNREPEPPGLQAWQNILNNCPQSGRDSSGNPCDRIEVSSDFYRSEEFQSRAFFLYRFYSVALGRIPHYEEFMTDLSRTTGFLTDEQVEAGRVAFVTEFMSRQEFKNKYDQTVGDPSAYVNALVSTAGVTLQDKQALADDLAQGRKSRADVLRAIVESPEVTARFFNEAFVVEEYFGYLRRDPDILYLDWIQTLNQTGDYRALVNGFVNSPEYRQRFGPQ